MLNLICYPIRHNSKKGFISVIRNKDIIISGVGLTLFFCFFTGITFTRESSSNNSAPTTGTISPSSGTVSMNTAISYTRAYYDANDWQGFSQVQSVINTLAALINCFYVYCDQNANKFYLRNDNNKSWVNGYAHESANIIGNSYLSLGRSKNSTPGSDATFWHKQVLIHKEVVNPC